MSIIKSQRERIRERLQQYGWVTRNMCLRQSPPITRVAARIKDLEKEGYQFKAEWRGKDYVYTVTQWPEGVRPETKLDHAARARRMCELFDAGAPTEQIFAV